MPRTDNDWPEMDIPATVDDEIMNMANEDASPEVRRVSPVSVSADQVTVIGEPSASQITQKQRTDRWKNRRKMAWISLGAIIGFSFTILVLAGMGIFTPEIISSITPLYQTFILALSGIIGAYIGFASYQTVQEEKLGVS